MGINIPEVERQKASKALNCDRQCSLSRQTVSGQNATLSALVAAVGLSAKCQ